MDPGGSLLFTLNILCIYVISRLYNSYMIYVRPHIEYCIQAWRPYYRESVQRRAIKMICTDCNVGDRPTGAGGVGEAAFGQLFQTVKKL